MNSWRPVRREGECFLEVVREQVDPAGGPLDELRLDGLRVDAEPADVDRGVQLQNRLPDSLILGQFSLVLGEIQDLEPVGGLDHVGGLEFFEELLHIGQPQVGVLVVVGLDRHALLLVRLQRLVNHRHEHHHRVVTVHLAQVVTLIIQALELSGHVEEGADPAVHQVADALP
jgi:hypothetical protein